MGTKLMPVSSTIVAAIETLKTRLERVHRPQRLITSISGFRPLENHLLC